MAAGDLDGDGRVDLVFNNIDSSPAVLKNVTKEAGHWIEFKLIGEVRKKSPRDAIGAIVYVTANKIRQRQDVVSGTSYSSQNDLSLHFGLGPVTVIDKLEVKWPDGSSESFAVSKVDRKVTLVQGTGAVK
jgi:enediyne biosynthesis protein E4